MSKKTLTCEPFSSLSRVKTLVHDLCHRISSLVACIEMLPEGHLLQAPLGQFWLDLKLPMDSTRTEMELQLDRAKLREGFLSAILKIAEEEQFQEILSPFRLHIELSRYLLSCIFHPCESDSVIPTVKVHEALGEVVDSFNVQFPNLCSLYSGPVCSAEIQPEFFKIALFNLLENAQRAIVGIENPKIEIFWELNDVQVRVCVKDNGPGIPSSILEHFGQFGFTTNQTGSGLGVASVSQTMQMARGRVVVETSTKGDQGTCISLFLFISSD